MSTSFDVNGTLGLIPNILELAFWNSSKKTAMYWYEQDEFKSENHWEPDHGKRIILGTYLNSTPDDHVLFPVPLDIPALVPIITDWVKAQGYRSGGGDGDYEQGVHGYNEKWGRIGNDWGSIVAFEATTLYYGK